MSIRYDVWVDACGCCKHCGKLVDFDGLWEMDHILPKSLGGPDGMSNRQMLCRKCNRKKGNRMETPRKIELGTVEFNFNESVGGSRGRMQIIAEATSQVVSMYRDEERSCSIMIPPRIGKTNVIYGAAIELRSVYKAPVIVVIAPWVTLAEQVRDEGKVRKHFAIYKPSVKKFSVDVLRPDNQTWFRSKDASGDPVTLMTSTICMVKHNLSQFVNGLQVAIDETGERPVVFIDECHLIGEGQEWSDMFNRIVDAGAFVVVLTGTADRSDSKKIPGFIYTESDRSRAETTVSSGIKLNEEGKLTKTKKRVFRDTTEYQVSADFHASWREAWDCGALCHLSATWIDCDVNIEERGSSYTKKLSELGDTELRKNMRQIVECPKLIDKCCEATIGKWIAAKHSLGIQPRWIVMAGVDYADDGKLGENTVTSNRHANLIRDSLVSHAQRKGLSLTVKVATLKNADSDPDNLKDFKKGCVDILVVKRMGVVGIDMDSIAGCTLLSTIRSGPTWSQFITRCATSIDGVHKVGQLVLPKDILNQNQFQAVVADHGGVAKVVETIELSSEEVEHDPNEDTSKPFASTDNHAVAGYSDSMKMALDGDMEEKILWVREHMQSQLSDIQIIQCIRDGIINVPPLENKVKEEFGDEDDYIFIDANAQADEMHRRLNRMATQHANKLADYSDPGQKGRWVVAKKQFWNEAKKGAGVNPNVANTSIRDKSKLKRMLAVAQNLVGVSV